jgi:hypothetical protein
VKVIIPFAGVRFEGFVFINYSIRIQRHKDEEKTRKIPIGSWSLFHLPVLLRVQDVAGGVFLRE